MEKINLKQLTAFVFQRQKEDGAFATCPSLPSTVADTFYALAILSVLDFFCPHIQLFSRIDKEKLLTFINAHKSVRESLPIRLRFFLSEIGDYISGAESACDYFRENIRPVKMVSFENFYYLDRLAPRGTTGLQTKRLKLADCTCKEVYYYILSFPEAAASRAGELVDWLRKCQNCDGGFGFFPGTTSYVEYCDYSLSALSLLNIRPADPVNAGQYICHCQTGAGGFSRSARAAPFLESSYHALRGLLCLRKFQGDFSTTLKGGSGREQFFRLISMCG